MFGNLFAPKKNPVEPPEYDADVVRAFRALNAGEANAGQQGMCVRFLLNDICGIDDISFRPDSDRNTTFAEGKRFVGLQLRKFLNYSPEMIEKIKNKRK